METVDVTKNNDINKLFSFEEMEEVTKRALSNDANLIEYTIRPYSDGRLGYLSSHYRVNITAMRKKETFTLSFFLKTVPYEVPDSADYVIKKGVFKQETMFYSVIMPLLLKEYYGEMWAAMCYKVKSDSMVFEELRDKGYSIRDKLFDISLVRAGLSALARMHAASLLAETRLGTYFNRLYPDAFVERGFVHEGMTREWIQSGIDVAAIVAERLGYDPDLIRSVCEEVYQIVKPSCTKTNVVSHGDLWANNFLFNNDVPPKCLLVDFQFMRYAPLAHDVAQLLYLCTDRSFRETWESTMLCHYYDTLRETLNIHEICVQIPPWSELIEGMEEQRLGAVITTILFFPTVLMDENLAAQVMNNPASYVKFYFRDRKEFVLSNMKKDPVYNKRISEAVIELAELASRLDQFPKPS
ncbi:PREDICTED: uncharacterized protein LOC108772202 [Cyphomyrmex costatus]|uniref:CHK kinase-like domain-containing protein n=1 Tax=Cyphomyrmex costatus TaxID=456900 RepID=A0A195CVU1_9HYME|nr:PREDICTED: uncharacterized protein LOC108772202 [Cyphomyrmex costatus]KYN04803.1 hypothetical protein ALC62_04187 [Cyphomyrmex costatus]